MEYPARDPPAGLVERPAAGFAVDAGLDAFLVARRVEHGGGVPRRLGRERGTGRKERRGRRGGEATPRP